MPCAKAKKKQGKEPAARTAAETAAAVRQAAFLSVDHITAWMGQGNSSSFAKSMREEIETNMLKALNLI